ILIVSALLGYVIYQMPAKQIAQTWKTAGKQIFGTAVALLFAVPMVRVLIQSGINDSGLESMPVVLAEGVASVARTTGMDSKPESLIDRKSTRLNSSHVSISCA